MPRDHPALGSITMNFAANLLGLDNAATPLGLRAMEELDGLNPRPGVATNAMCMLMAMNAAGLTLVPTTVIGVLIAVHARNPAAIIAPTLVAGFLLAFTLSWDDVVITSLLAGAGVNTLPTLVFSSVKFGLSPKINALATLIVVVVTTGVLVANRVMLRQRKPAEPQEEPVRPPPAWTDAPATAAD